MEPITNLLERMRATAAILEAREAQPKAPVVDKALRAERLRVAAIPLEEHIRRHVIGDTLEHTPALAAVRPVVTASSSGFSLSATVGLLGERGRGKTVAIADAIAMLGGRYVKIGRAAQLMKRARVADEKEWEAMLVARVLGVDELGAELERDSVDSILALHELVDERQSNGRITLLASNLDQHELERRYDARTFDRLRSQWKVVELEGTSYRQRRPWHVVLKLDERTRDAKVIEERYQKIREYRIARSGPGDDERVVELLWARDVALELARTEAA
jgi:hypothetical protein